MTEGKLTSLKVAISLIDSDYELQKALLYQRIVTYDFLKLISWPAQSHSWYISLCYLINMLTHSVSSQNLIFADTHLPC